MDEIIMELCNKHQKIIEETAEYALSISNGSNAKARKYLREQFYKSSNQEFHELLSKTINHLEGRALSD